MLFVLKLNKLISSKDEHLSNNEVIIVTLVVSKLDTSMLFKFLHDKNVDFIDFNLGVTKDERSKLVKVSH